MAVPRINPYSAFNFIVRLNGVEIGGFMEASGLDSENAVIEYREGNDQTGQFGAFVRKLPGMERYPNAMLRRGITGNLRIWNELRLPLLLASIGPEFGPVFSVTPLLEIDLQNELHQTVQTFQLANAWVSKLSGPSLNAKSNEVAIESVEVVYQRLALL